MWLGAVCLAEHDTVAKKLGNTYAIDQERV